VPIKKPVFKFSFSLKIKKAKAIPYTGSKLIDKFKVNADKYRSAFNERIKVKWVQAIASINNIIQSLVLGKSLTGSNKCMYKGINTVSIKKPKNIS
jgi:hypothetical protein